MTGKEDDQFHLELEGAHFHKPQSGSFAVSKSPKKTPSITKAQMTGNGVFPNNRKSSKSSATLQPLNLNKSRDDDEIWKHFQADANGPSNFTSSSMPNVVVSKHLVENNNNNFSPRTPSKRNPFLIGVSGGSASGKTSVCERILSLLNTQSVDIISQDSFYKVLNQEEILQAKNANYNFDHPKSFDFQLLKTVIRDLKNGKTVKVPDYDFVTHSRTSNWKLVGCLDVVIVEGILLFYDPEIVEMMDMRIFVDEDADTRLARRIRRDITERGRDLDNVLTQYLTFVKPAFEEFILPTKKYADIIIPRGRENIVAINLIVQHIKYQLQNRKKQTKPSTPYEF